MKFLLLMIFCSFVWAVPPSVDMTGGRYYIYVEGVQEPGYYMSIHTAYAAAVNKALECDCTVTVIQPDIKVVPHYPDPEPIVDPPDPTPGTVSVRLKWDLPTAREDGTPLERWEIDYYLIVIDEDLPTETIVQINDPSLTTFLYQAQQEPATFTMYTVDIFLVKSQPTPTIRFEDLI